MTAADDTPSPSFTPYFCGECSACNRCHMVMKQRDTGAHVCRWYHLRPAQLRAEDYPPELREVVV